MTVEKLSLRIPARLSLPPEDLPWTEDGPHLQGNLKTTFIQIQSKRDPLPSHLMQNHQIIQDMYPIRKIINMKKSSKPTDCNWGRGFLPSQV